MNLHQQWKVIGADLALNHGAVIGIDETVYHFYTDGIGMMSTADSLYQIAFAAAEATPRGSIVCIDWDRHWASWNRNADIGNLMTMLVAFYGALCNIRECTVHYITPSLVRWCLGLPQDCKKETVHDKVNKLVSSSFPKDKEGDYLDAWILAHTYECSKKEFSL